MTNKILTEMQLFWGSSLELHYENSQVYQCVYINGITNTWQKTILLIPEFCIKLQRF